MRKLVHVSLLVVFVVLTGCSTSGKVTNKGLEKLGPRTNALHGGFNW